MIPDPFLERGMKQDTLIVYYSRTGHTSAVAQEMANRMDAVVHRLSDAPDSGDILSRALDALRGRAGGYAPLPCDVASFTRVVVASPVWFGHVPPAVAGFLRQEGGRARELALIVTRYLFGGRSACRAMERHAGRSAVAYGNISDREVKSGIYPEAVAVFIDALHHPDTED